MVFLHVLWLRQIFTSKISRLRIPTIPKLVLMDTPPKTSRIPRATIQRLATYIQVLENLARDGTEIISSTPLAEACGVNGSQIRKDLAYFGEFGIRGVGYNVTSLIAAIT